MRAAAARMSGSGGCNDDGAAVALEGLEGVTTGALTDQLRLVPAGSDVDRKLNTERIGDTQQHWERWVVLPALQPRDGGLTHPQALGQRGLAETVLRAVGDHLHGHGACQGRALPLPTVLGKHLVSG